MEPSAHRVWIEDVAARHLVVARGRATMAELPARIVTLATVAWEAVRAGSIPTTGHNVVLYPLAAAGDAGHEELPLEAGAEILAPYVGPGPAQRSMTPAGACTTTLHVGPYQGLPAAHAAVRGWARAEGRPLAGPAWEVYGHWHDDPALLQTHVFYLLRP